TWRKSVGDLRYEIAGNISTYQNKVLSLGNGDAIYGSAYNSNVVTKTEVGKPVGYFYGYLTNGIFQNATEVEGSAQRSTAVPGDIRYKDIYPAEEPDDVLDDNDRAMIGSPWPDFVYGLTLSAAWRGFDASIFFQGSQGNDVLNMTLYDFDSGTGYMNALDGILERAWNGEGSTDRYHRISADQGQNQLVSDYYVEDGSYLRIKNVQIGYNFCNNLIHTKWLSNFRVYVSAQNLLTLTKYSGLDPEIGSSSPILNGIDQGYYPQARTFCFGVNLKF
ncbi:MAG: SusC/RagA family protein, partial [Bacteroidales bacterium]|nr:SusC/RagA family protein [Bacteroidales bacterium]